MAGIANGLQSLTLGARPVALSSRAACRAQPVVSRGASTSQLLCAAAALRGA
jgi:hypothetical protein